MTNRWEIFSTTTSRMLPEMLNHIRLNHSARKYTWMYLRRSVRLDWTRIKAIKNACNRRMTTQWGVTTNNGWRTKHWRRKLSFAGVSSKAFSPVSVGYSLQRHGSLVYNETCTTMDNLTATGDKRSIGGRNSSLTFWTSALCRHLQQHSR